jgi:hypothetical protein
MATISITEIECVRKQDVFGKDDVEIYVGGTRVWEDKMGKGDTLYPNTPPRSFSGSIGVELRERNGKSTKSLEYWTVDENTANPLSAISGPGYHYRVHFDFNK